MNNTLRLFALMLLVEQALLFSCKVKNPDPAPVFSVQLQAAAHTVIVGQPLQLTAVLEDGAGTVLTGRPVSWTVDAPSLANVSQTGLVQTLLPGTVTITATSEGKSGQLTLTISKIPVASVSLKPDTVMLLVGRTAQLQLVIKDANGTVVTDRAVGWASSDSTKIRISSAGLITALAGTLRPISVTATCEGKSATTTVVINMPEAIVTAKPEGPLYLPQNSTTTIMLELRSVFGFVGPASLQFKNLPPGITVEPFDNPIAVPKDGVVKVMLSVNAADASLGESSFRIQTQNGLTETAYIQKLTIVPYTNGVRLFYLVPADKVINPAVAKGMERAIRHLQIWYQQQLGDRTFTIRYPVVTTLNTPHPTNWYATTPNSSEQWWYWYNAANDGMALTGGSYNDPNNIWVYYVDADPAEGQAGGASSGKVVVVSGYDVRGVSGGKGWYETDPISRYVGGLGHEIGHSFGLSHPTTGCNESTGAGCQYDAIMMYGYITYPNAYLTGTDKWILNMSQFFQKRSVAPAYWDCSSLGTSSPGGRRAVITPDYRTAVPCKPPVH